MCMKASNHALHRSIHTRSYQYPASQTTQLLRWDAVHLGAARRKAPRTRLAFCYLGLTCMIARITDAIISTALRECDEAETMEAERTRNARVRN